jgi:hypothetical protein
MKLKQLFTRDAVHKPGVRGGDTATYFLAENGFEMHYDGGHTVHVRATGTVDASVLVPLSNVKDMIPFPLEDAEGAELAQKLRRRRAPK